MSAFAVFFLSVLFWFKRVTCEYPFYETGPVEISCNKTLYYLWREKKYLGPLATDPRFWMYQQKAFFELKQGLALDLAAAKCKDYFNLLIRFRAGRTGPVDIQHGYKAMCSHYCLESDNLHVQAMTYSGCSCGSLSSQPDDPSYTQPGDWCEHNSARQLCTIVGYCGVWNCRVDDFMCPRYEWNKKYVSLKGPGTCLRNSAVRNMGTSSWTWLFIFLAFASFAMHEYV